MGYIKCWSCGAEGERGASMCDLNHKDGCRWLSMWETRVGEVKELFTKSGIDVIDKQVRLFLSNMDGTLTHVDDIEDHEEYCGEPTPWEDLG